MPKRFTLLALWALFAAAAVGVGFGASGLVGQPFEVSPPTSATDVGSSEVSEQTPSISPTPSDSASKAAPVVRGQNTRGGYVSGSCTGRLVQVSAAPASGWQLSSRTTGSVRTARVRFEPAEDDHGERITVYVRCVGGVPTFDRRDRPAQGGGGDQSSTPGSGGGGDHGGGGGDGGGDDTGGGGGDSGGDD